jgi:hypothetical protein
MIPANTSRLIYAMKLQQNYSVLCQLHMRETAAFKWHAMKAASDNIYQSSYEMTQAS